MAFLPLIALAITAAGTAASAIQKSQADKYNATVDTNEANAARAEGVTQEDIVRRNSRESLGRQQSAFASANVGFGGSSKGALDTSAINQEMDALNTRYRGNLTAYGYQTQSQLDQQDSKNQLVAGAFGVAGDLAGSKALNFAGGPGGSPGGAPSYTGTGVMNTWQGNTSTNNLA